MIVGRAWWWAWTPACWVYIAVIHLPGTSQRLVTSPQVLQIAASSDQKELGVAEVNMLCSKYWCDVTPIATPTPSSQSKDHGSFLLAAAILKLHRSLQPATCRAHYAQKESSQHGVPFRRHHHQHSYCNIPKVFFGC